MNSKTFLKKQAIINPFQRLTFEGKKIIFCLKDYFIYFKHQLNADGLRNQSGKLVFLFHFE